MLGPVCWDLFAGSWHARPPARGCCGCGGWALVVAENQEGFVLYKEFMPVFGPLLPTTAGGADSSSGGSGRSASSSPTVCGCLIAVASMMADALGWGRNPSYLPIMHERFFQLTTELEKLVGALHSCRAHWAMVCCLCTKTASVPLGGPVCSFGCQGVCTAPLSVNVPAVKTRLTVTGVRRPQGQLWMVCVCKCGVGW